MSLKIENYLIKGQRAHYFTGPTSSPENNFQTVPDLLRAVADWMDDTGIEDPEFDSLRVGVTFTGEGDNYYQHATVYYLDNHYEALVQEQSEL